MTADIGWFFEKKSQLQFGVLLYGVITAQLYAKY